jgi:hypothetical protein
MPTRILFVLLAAVSTAPLPKPCPLLPADTCTSYPPDGRRYDSTITPEMQTTSSDWSETDDNPPLSARRAIALAEAALPTFLKDIHEWERTDARYLSSVSLVPLGGKKWSWKVDYRWLPRVGSSRGTPLTFCVFVLMDGTVVKPKVIGGDAYKSTHP